ncbi:MAG TPA: acyl-CoA synthetase [Acidimicrobiales bacterium]
MFVGDFAASAPDRAAVVMGGSGRVISYRELDERSSQFARLLWGLGLRRGDHYAVMMENHPSYFELVWAGMRSGLYVTAVNSHLTPAEAAYIVNDCGATVLVISAALATVAEELRALTPAVEHRFMVDGATPGHRSYEHETAAQSTAHPDVEVRGMVMLYSSGTTGQPKGIEFPLPPEDSPIGEWEIGEHSRTRYGFGEGMVFLSPGPLYHSAPLRVSLAVHSLGGTVVVMERFDPAGALALIERERVTHSQWVPTMFVRMLKLPEEERTAYDLSSQRVVTHAAAPCPVPVKEQMIAWWGPIIEEYYAGTENVGSTSITSEEWLAHKGSVGRPARGASIHICDDQGDELPTGEVGAVYFEDAEATFEYHGDAAKTSGTQHPDHPTWRSLGDIGRVDEEGYLYLTDRRAFMIVSGGVNIYPQEIEDVLVAHPRVLDAAVFGVPNEDMGEEVKAVVQPVRWEDAGDALAAELQAWCEGRLAGYKRPRSFDFDPQLPRLDNGKLYKGPVRDRYWEGRSTRVL